METTWEELTKGLGVIGNLQRFWGGGIQKWSLGRKAWGWVRWASLCHPSLEIVRFSPSHMEWTYRGRDRRKALGPRRETQESLILSVFHVLPLGKSTAFIKNQKNSLEKENNKQTKSHISLACSSCTLGNEAPAGGYPHRSGHTAPISPVCGPVCLRWNAVSSSHSQGSTSGTPALLAVSHSVPWWQ